MRLTTKSSCTKQFIPSPLPMFVVFVGMGSRDGDKRNSRNIPVVITLPLSAQYPATTSLELNCQNNVHRSWFTNCGFEQLIWGYVLWFRHYFVILTIRIFVLFRKICLVRVLFEYDFIVGCKIRITNSRLN